MKKLFTSLAAMAVAVSAVAADHDFSYTVDPAEGEVSILQFVTLTFPNVDEIEINSKSDINILRGDGSVVRGVEISVENDNELAFVLGAEQTDPGTYIVNIPAGTLAGYADSYSWWEDNSEDIMLVYTIAGQPVSGVDWTYQLDPAEGTVDELQEIYLYFPNLTEMDINTMDDIVLSYNNTALSDVNVNQVDANLFCISTDEPLTTPGTYTLTIAKYALCAYDVEWYPYDLPEELKFTWTIEGAASEVDFAYTSSLPTDEFLAYFGDLTLTFDNLDNVSCEQGGVSVTFNGEALEDVTVSTDANKLTVTLKDALNFVEGKVVVNIASEALTGNASGSVGTNAAPISIEYSMATPVEYNLELAISTPKPNADGQISADKSLESIFFVCEEKGLVAAAGSGSNVTIKEVNGDFEATARLRKSNGVNANYSYFTAAFGKEPTYNGLYTITIQKGAFGTEAWAEDANYGRANDEIQLTFELVDGSDYATYTLDPVSVNPIEGTYGEGKEIATVTLTFEDGVSAVKGASATLAGVTSSYAETAEFTTTEAGFTVTFATAPSENGKYVLTVVPGMFGDEGFIADGKGKANAPINIEYTVDNTVGVTSIVGDKDAVIYTIQGLRTKTSAENLPAGVYVIDGKKVVIKK